MRNFGIFFGFGLKPFEWIIAFQTDRQEKYKIFGMSLGPLKFAIGVGEGDAF